MRVKEALKNAVISGILSFLICFIIVYFVIPQPNDKISFAMGNGISGIISGVLSAFATIKIMTSGVSRQTMKKLMGEVREPKFALSAEDNEKPYSKYFDLPLAEPNKELIRILDKGPINPSKALMPENINDLLNPGHFEVETGYCRLPNGAGYLAVNNIFPGVTVDMINWWFAWHPLEDMRYMLWFNKGHHGIRVSDEDRAAILDPKTTMTQKFQGRTHHVVENTGCGIEDIHISFLTPEEMGFDMSRFKSPAVGTIIAANGISCPINGGPEAPAVMIHFVREIPGGVEFRTRFWMGYHMVNGKPVKKLPFFIKVPMESIRGLAYHNVEEFSNLAAILPSLYEEMEGIVS